MVYNFSHFMQQMLPQVDGLTYPIQHRSTQSMNFLVQCVLNFLLQLNYVTPVKFWSQTAVVGKIYELIGNKRLQRLEPNLSLFILGEDRRLYYKGKPLMNRNGEPKTIGVIADTLGIGGLREMGYNISKTNLKPRFVLDLMEKQVKLPSSSEIAGTDEIELEEIAESTEDLIFQINSQSQMSYSNILYMSC